MLAEGIEWGAWETFDEYLSVLGSRPRTMDVGCLLGHGCVRARAAPRGRSFARGATDLNFIGAVCGRYHRRSIGPAYLS